MRNMKHAKRSPFTDRGFTLVELMIAVAISLMLMIGVNQVFRATSDTVGAGQAISGIGRDDRAVQNTFFDDMNGFAPDTPMLIIHNEQLWAFRDAQDQAQDVDGKANTYLLSTQSGAEQLQAPAIYNYRSHRIDMISFCARGTYTRQTSAGPYYFSSTGSNEAYIWYGHLKLADNVFPPSTATDYPMLAAGTTTSNPNGLYATQWVLGRMAILLRPDANNYYGYLKGPITNDSTTNPPAVYLAPLGFNTPADQTPWLVQQTRFDLAQASIQSFRDAINAFIASPPSSTASGNWYLPLDGFNSMTSNPQPNGSYRFNGRGWLGKPMTSDEMALYAPYLLGGCTQFIVEYAGDFLTQNTDSTSTSFGQVTGPYNANTLAGDGQVDFVVDPLPGGNGYANGMKRIRWYGMPRDVASNPSSNANGGADGYIPGGASNNNVGATANTSLPYPYLPDVVPLRDVMKTGTGTFPAQATFEKWLSVSPGGASLTDYGPNGPVSPSGLPGMAPLTTAVDTDPMYVCAWSPTDPKPKMIRITVVIRDPNGRVPNGLTFEYVFTLPN